MDLTKMTLQQLREVAKEKGITGVTGLRKPDLAVKIAEVMQKEAKAERKTERKPERKAERKPERKPEPQTENKAEHRSVGVSSHSGGNILRITWLN